MKDRSDLIPAPNGIIRGEKLHKPVVELFEFFMSRLRYHPIQKSVRFSKRRLSHWEIKLKR